MRLRLDSRRHNHNPPNLRPLTTYDLVLVVTQGLQPSSAAVLCEMWRLLSCSLPRVNPRGAACSSRLGHAGLGSGQPLPLGHAGLKLTPRACSSRLGHAGLFTAPSRLFSVLGADYVLKNTVREAAKYIRHSIHI